MSQETSKWLNQNVLIGFTEKRGTAWHYRASDQGSEPNHYPRAIPVEDVRRRLFFWEPEEAPLETTVKVGRKKLHLIDNSRKVIVRPDTETILGVFKNGYKVHGYDQWLVHNVETVLDTDELFIGSAGLLRKGAVGWVQFELEETQSVCDVEYRPFLTAATSLDGSLATTYKTGAQVAVCDNTLSAALSGTANKYAVKHSSRSLGKVIEVRDKLQIVFKTSDDFAAMVEALTTQKVSEKVWKKFLDEFVKTNPQAGKRAQTLGETKRDLLDALYHKDARVAPWKGTAYGVLAAANTYDHHFAHVRGVSRPERNMLNMVTGQVDRTDADVLRVLATVSA